MEVIDIQAVKECLAEVSDCEDKQYAIALLEWAIGKRTFNIAEHDAELLDKVAERIKGRWLFRGTDENPYRDTVDNVIEELKAEVSE